MLIEMISCETHLPYEDSYLYVIVSKNLSMLDTSGFNPSYSGDRDHEDGGSKPAWANNSRDFISKKLITKKGWWSGSRCTP
jgi:hypothetical protein